MNIVSQLARVNLRGRLELATRNGGGLRGTVFCGEGLTLDGRHL